MLEDLELFINSRFPNRLHPHRPPFLQRSEHTKTARYRNKKRIVKGLWIASGLMMLSYPLLSFMVTLGLFTTFLSFTILDESA